jgi:adenosylcobinamide amidohydrolase
MADNFREIPRPNGQVGREGAGTGTDGVVLRTALVRGTTPPTGAGDVQRVGSRTRRAVREPT